MGSSSFCVAANLCLKKFEEEAFDTAERKPTVLFYCVWVWNNWPMSWKRHRASWKTEYNSCNKKVTIEVKVSKKEELFALTNGKTEELYATLYTANQHTYACLLYTSRCV